MQAATATGTATSSAQVRIQSRQKQLRSRFDLPVRQVLRRQRRWASPIRPKVPSGDDRTESCVDCAAWTHCKWADDGGTWMYTPGSTRVLIQSPITSAACAATAGVSRCPAFATRHTARLGPNTVPDQSRCGPGERVSRVIARTGCTWPIGPPSWGSRGSRVPILSAGISGEPHAHILPDR